MRKCKVLVKVLTCGSCFLLAFALTGAQPRKPALVDILQEAIDGADPMVNIFLNDKRLAIYQARVEEETDPVQKIVRRTYLPVELLRGGPALAALEETLELQRLAIEWDTPADSQIMKDFRAVIALGYLRLGEQENCILKHTSDSCLFPIQGAGIHEIQRGSRMAIRNYLSLLEENPENLIYRWLLNLAYMTLGEYPDKVPERWLIPPETFKSDYEIERFPDIAPAVGLDLIGVAGGSILEDFDRDGFLDVVASSYYISDQMQYLHNNGDGSFSNWTEQSGLLGQLGGLNLAQGDYNNDGFADILVLRGAWFSILGQGAGNYPNSLLRNKGDGTFEDVTIDAGLLGLHPTHTAVFVDYDLDGWLDIFFGNESVADEIHPCQLFRNKGDGTFADVAPEVGLNHIGFVKGSAWGDYNNDGYPDVYFSRFQQSNLLFRNDGSDGDQRKFTDVTTEAGVENPVPSFPVWFWDYDNDGWEDLFVACFSAYLGSKLEESVADYLGISKSEHSRLYRNNRDGTFSNVTKEAKLDAVLLSMGANYGDIDNDGFLDAYIGTGQPAMNSLVPNRMFRNSGGSVFQDVTTSGGFGHLQKGHGISYGDIDNDGDQDIYAVLGGAYSGDTYQNALFQNPGSNNHWVILRLVGDKSNRTAVGARIKVTTVTETGNRDIFVTLGTGGSFGGSSLQQEIGLGQAKSIESIEIRWPNRAKSVQLVKDVPMGRTVEIREGVAEPRLIPVTQIRFPSHGSHQGHQP